MSNAERLNRTSLSEEEKKDIDSTYCYNLKRATSQVLSKLTDIIQTPADDQTQQKNIATDFMQSSLQFLEKLEALNAQPNGVYTSSIILDIIFQNCEDLEAFMSKFRDGKIAEITQDSLVTERVLSILNLQSLQFLVSVSEEDCEKYHRKLHMRDVDLQGNAMKKVSITS